MNYKEIIKKLESLKNPKNVEGMARFGIRPKTKVFGVSMSEIRKTAKIIGKNHDLALKLWDSKIHEAKILASIIDDPEELTESQMEKWARGFDSWDVCDQTCMNLFSKAIILEKARAPVATGARASVQIKNLSALIFDFAKRKEEFVKRTAFALIAALAVHDKRSKDKDFTKFFPLIEKASIDERNFVKKAVNWALRQIGKRNKKLNKEAIKLAKKIQKFNSKSAVWIANDAIRELTSKSMQSNKK